MEAKCKFTRIIGFTCCLAILAAVSADRGLDVARAADPADFQTPTLQTVLGQKAHNVKVATPKVDSLTGYAIEAAGSRSAQGGGNDDCVGATPVTDGATPFDTTGATLDGSAPPPCDNNMFEDVWFVYTATCNGLATIGSGCNDVPEPDTTLEVFGEGTCPPVNTIGCADDNCGTGSGFASVVTVSVTMGNGYLIRIGGWNGGAVAGNLDISCAGGGPVCGDTICNGKETCKDCPEDCGPCCPLSGCEGDTATITQSVSSSDGENQVACAGGGTTPNSWARCYDMTAEGYTSDVAINSVTFGIQQATVDGLTVTVNLYLDSDGCPPVEPGGDAILLDSVSTIVGPADEGTLITLNFPGAPVAPAGSTLIVEIDNPDDCNVEPFCFFRAMSNPDGQCGPSYIRAAGCGLGWTDLADIGFPDAHLVEVTLGTTACEGGGGGDGNECEDCLSVEPNVAVSGTTADNDGTTGDDTMCT
ncbi:MAG: hypothetical protein IID41_05285, partial [Planctomycetes bacterium]|nr:hypothetical protein [Planctomycetota bacterium]